MMRLWHCCFLLLIVLCSCWTVAILHFCSSTARAPLFVVLQWSVAQWLPSAWPPLASSIGRHLQETAWREFRNAADNDYNDNDVASINNKLECPVLDLSEIITSSSSSPSDTDHHCTAQTLLKRLESKYGKDWRDRPLLLRGLWSRADLESSSNANQKEQRRLSLQGLLKEDLVIPYFSNASMPHALTPDGRAPISQIVQNMIIGAAASSSSPHKIGTQLLVQTYPELIREVAPPTDVVKALFGNHFEPHHVGTGRLGFLPPTTTVPIFVAPMTAPHTTTTTAAAAAAANKSNDDDLNGTVCDGEHEETPNGTTTTTTTRPTTRTETKAPPLRHARTDLHCEPIGNVAVQLRGEKQWLLVPPQYSFWIQPSASPDGRAFFASFASIQHDVVANNSDGTAAPRYYQATTRAGDALWIPTWTWHRVDYVSDDAAASSSSGSSHNDGNDVSIGASLFHFRPLDFFRNNPLFAMLIIPNLIKELLGYNTQ